MATIWQVRALGDPWPSHERIGAQKSATETLRAQRLFARQQQQLTIGTHLAHLAFVVVWAAFGAIRKSWFPQNTICKLVVDLRDKLSGKNLSKLVDDNCCCWRKGRQQHTHTQILEAARQEVLARRVASIWPAVGCPSSPSSPSSWRYLPIWAALVPAPAPPLWCGPTLGCPWTHAHTIGIGRDHCWRC